MEFLELHELQEFQNKFYVLELKPRYKNKMEVLNTLTQEMLHLWQQTVKRDTGRHNKRFFSFKNKSWC